MCVWVVGCNPGPVFAAAAAAAVHHPRSKLPRICVWARRGRKRAGFRGLSGSSLARLYIAPGVPVARPFGKRVGRKTKKIFFFCVSRFRIFCLITRETGADLCCFLDLGWEKCVKIERGM